MTPAEIEQRLAHWPGLEGARASLVNHSENHTFFLELAERRYALRVHRPGYHDALAIESELAWLAALARDTVLPVPTALPGRDFQYVQRLPDANGDRLAVLFRFQPGREAQPDADLGRLFRTLGEYAAQAHAHVERWQRPVPFVRPHWTCADVLNPHGAWGDWRRAPGLDASSAAVIVRLAAALRSAFSTYGQEPERFNLIHADMRLANVLLDGALVRLIDFDDCGFGWFVYDFAAAVSFMEDDPRLPALKSEWMEGYSKHRRLAAADIAMLDSAVMLRRIALLAWIGSHGETRLAQSHSARFASGTAKLADRYLASGRL